MSVRPSSRLAARNNWATAGRIFMEFDIWVFFENLSIEKNPSFKIGQE